MGRGPAQDIYDYVDGPVALERFVAQVERRARRLPQFVAIDDIAQFLSRDDDRERRERLGWSRDLRTGLAARCAEIKSEPEWRTLAVAGLGSSDPETFYDAERTARALGIDTFPAHWKRLQADPRRGDWHAVMDRVDRDLLPDVLNFARRTLPLGELGRGANARCPTAFRTWTAFDIVVTRLSRFPGQGWDLVAVGLRSPVIRVRNMAISTLQAWTPAAWPPEARPAIERALADEPEEDLRTRLVSLLQPA